MKAFILLTLLTTTAFAGCPDLTGVYRTCRSTSEDVSVDPYTITQSTKDGITTYTFIDSATVTASEMSSDGVVSNHTEIQDGVSFDLSMSASCKNDKFIVDLTAVSAEFSSQTKSVFTKNGSVLSIVSTADFQGQTEEITTICTE